MKTLRYILQNMMPAKRLYMIQQNAKHKHTLVLYVDKALYTGKALYTRKMLCLEKNALFRNMRVNGGTCGAGD